MEDGQNFGSMDGMKTSPCFRQRDEQEQRKEVRNKSFEFQLIIALQAEACIQATSPTLLKRGYLKTFRITSF